MANAHEKNATPKEAPRREPPGFLDRLAERLGGRVDARMIYGEPVVREGITVIPVGRVRYGFGGGRGANAEVGGGGGAEVVPVGYIEIRDGQSEFRPICGKAPWLLGLGAGLGLAWLLRRRGH